MGRTRQSQRIKAEQHVEDLPEEENEEELEDEDRRRVTGKRKSRLHEAEEDDDEGEEEDEDEGLPGDNIDGKELEVAAIVKAAYESTPLLDVSEVPGERGNKLDAGLVKDIVSRMMRYILFMNLNNQKCTTKKIREKAMKIGDYSPPAQAREALFRIVMDRFDKVFGYKLVCTLHAPVLSQETKNLTKKKRKAADGTVVAETKRKKTDSDVWILINLLNAKDEEEKVRIWKTRQDNDKRGQLLTVLTILVLNEGKMQEKQLKNMLVDKLDFLAEGSANNPMVVDNFLKELESDLYLSRKKADETTLDQEAIFEYTYGPKAILEIGLPNLLRFAKRVYPGMVLSEEDKERLLGTVA